MTIYRFSDASAIQEIVFRHVKDRPTMALFTAAKETDPVLLSAIRRSIEDHGWQCVPANVNGRDVLQVMGFATEAECQAFVADRHFTDGAAQIILETGENSAPVKGLGIRDFLKRRSLQMAGVFNLIGDI